ncbi:MAG: hypothetical protein GY739_07660, partial [Mesoflavibacter sp.]|nr:hypothetical protein [Mesoflavibacter sp.]
MEVLEPLLEKVLTPRREISGRNVVFFDASGKLIKIQDRNHNKMIFYYDFEGRLSGIMDTMGRMYSFDYYPLEIDEVTAEVALESGRLKTITDYTGRKVEYTYNIDTGDLETVDFEGRVTKYKYTQSNNITLAHNLEKIIDPRGAVLDDSPVLTIGYSAIDRVATQRFAENDRDILFSIGETTTTVTDARGIDKIFKHLAENKREIVVDGFTTSIELNTDTLIEKITLPEGNSIRYTYDSQNENRLGQGNVKTATRTGKNGVDT